MPELLRASTITWIDEGGKGSRREAVSLKTANGMQIEISVKGLLPLFRLARLLIKITDYGDWTEVPIPLIERTDFEDTALDLELKIHALRQLYALIYLLETDRIETAADYFNFDLERLLNDDERLRIVSVSIGSLWVTLRSWSSGGRSAIGTLLSLFFQEGRDSVLRRLRARTEMIEWEAEDKRLSVLRKIEKIKNPQLREEAVAAYKRHLKTLGGRVDLDKNSSSDPNGTPPPASA